ncbi:MAG: LysR family transcriptional regulator [Clostridia bacterium]|nr:LysR family transcriptional regulator [Clostridia bacterium]
MKTEQIILALTIAREKSISKAAEVLFISQPTASNLLKSLENELGYSLFQRTRTGILPTHKGTEFLTHAVTIERSLNAISQISEDTKKLDFKIVSQRFDFSVFAFEKLCEKYHANEQVIDFNFQIINDSVNGFKTVEYDMSDVAVLMCGKAIYESVTAKAAQKQMDTTFLGERNLELTCRKGHPILQDGAIAYHLLSEYTCFTGIHNSLSSTYAPYFLEKHGIHLKNCITMSAIDERYRLLHKTNGFLISTPVSPAIQAAYGLESIAIDNMEIYAFALFHKHSTKLSMIEEYIRYCKRIIG